MLWIFVVSKTLSLMASHFTWCNRRPGDRNVWIRLDRGVAIMDWILRFPTSRIHHMECFHLDHRSILLISDAEQKCFYRKGRPFKFEAMWLKDKTCENVIKESWEDVNDMILKCVLSKKISTCQENLKIWNCVAFGQVRTTLAKKLKDLCVVEEASLYRTNPTQIHVLHDDIQVLKAKEEAMWKQRSHVEWLKEGGQNTRYFHYRANQCNKRNYILGLKDEFRRWFEDEDHMGSLVDNYFTNMFTTLNPTNFDEILSGVLPSVIEEMNSRLVWCYMVVEIQKALNQMAPLTTPGLDGMSRIFYKSFWHIVGKDVIEVVLTALNSGIIPESLNITFLALIPKIKDARKVLDFRPISLCNVVYKLIAKVLVNRLKLIFPYIVFDSQSAFLLGRLIIGNVLAAFETLHYLKRKTQGKLGYMALKLDMSKSYDKVECDFLEKAMLHLGFHGRFVATIMSCIKLVSYSVLLNGVPGGHIKPNKGLQQGDLLSPYLYLVCAMGLQGLLHKAESDGSLREEKWSSGVSYFLCR